MSEASVARARTALGRGYVRGTVATRAALAAARAVSMLGVQGRALGLPESAAVSGRRVLVTLTAVEIHHTQKSLHSFAVGWFREIQNDLNVVPKGGDDGCGDAVALEIQLGDGEHALLQVEGQAVGSGDGEQCVEVGPVLLSGFAEDTVII